MYPILYRLLDKGYIIDEKRLVGKRKTRVYYKLEPKGKEYLNQLYIDYMDINTSIIKIMEQEINNVVKQYLKECRRTFPFISKNEKLFFKRLEDNYK